MYSLSFIIRAYNEREKLRELIESIRSQDYPADLIELIVVDNGSSDGTGELAKELGAKVVLLPQAEFTYPKSLNVGCEVAKNDILVMVSAHCLFWRRDALQKAVSHFNDKQVAGVYGPTIARRPHTLRQWIVGWEGYLRALILGPIQVVRLRLGILGNTNAMIRRSLWQQHPFDEAYAMGAEDSAWASWAWSKNYQIIREPAFVVRHSHHLGFFDSLKQRRLWGKTMAQPKPFDPSELEYRKDIQRDPK